MHDLVHDLAISVSKEDCFNDENNGTGSHILSGVIYLAIQSLGEESHKIMEKNAIYLRTLCLGSNLADDLFKDLKRLHVLNLSGTGIEELSSSVGALIHLRLLDVSETWISTLPDSICELYNLQTLNIYDCCRLKRLPNHTHFLLNMRHLIFHEDAEIETPCHIGKFTCLRRLPAFSVSLEEGRRIVELGYLKSLKGELWIQNLENVKDKEEAKRSDLIGKPNMQQLCLEWSTEEVDEAGGNNHKEVLEGFEPHQNIKSLTIGGFFGDKFPAWTMKMMVNDATSLVNLVKMKLYHCPRCEEIPTMGHLPSHKELWLNKLENVKSIGLLFYDPRYCCENSVGINSSFQPPAVPFRALEELKIMDMSNLVEWVAPMELSTTTSKVIGFPLLKYLSINASPKLKAIPSHDLGFLETLYLWNVEDSFMVDMTCNNNLISLRKLWFSGCSITTCSLSKLIQANQHHLEELNFSDCHELIHLEFPDEEEREDDHTTLQYSFKELYICNCVGLESIRFTSGQCRSLPSLQRLIVTECPNLASVALETHNLSSQRIRDCPKWKDDVRNNC